MSSMEIELLNEMLDEREKRISLLERKRHDQDAKAQRLTRQLEIVQRENISNRLIFQTARQRLRHTNKTTTDQLRHLQRDWQQQGAASLISLPARMRNAASGGANDAAYVMRMQAQLCKAMHSMGIMEHQMELAKQHADDIIRLQRDVLTSMTEEKTKIELKIMNDLVVTDSENRAIEAQLKSKLDEIRRDIEDVERQLEETRGSDDEDEDEEEDDEEEKAAKNELMMMLKDQNDKISKLQEEIELQRENIEELETELEQLGLGIGESSSRDDDPVAPLVEAPQPTPPAPSATTDEVVETGINNASNAYAEEFGFSEKGADNGTDEVADVGNEAPDETSENTNTPVNCTEGKTEDAVDKAIESNSSSQPLPEKEEELTEETACENDDEEELNNEVASEKEERTRSENHHEEEEKKDPVETTGEER